MTFFICRPKEWTTANMNEVVIKAAVEEGDAVIAKFEAESIPEGTVFWRPELTAYTPLGLKNGVAKPIWSSGQARSPV